MSAEMVWTTLLPEVFLLAGLLLLLGLEIAVPRHRGAFAVSLLAVAAAAAAAVWLSSGGFAADPFPGHYSVGLDTFAAKVVVLALAVPVLLLARGEFPGGPFYPLLIASLFGVCLVVSADSFLTLFLGVELMSIPVYVLVVLAFQREESAEAALKYLVLSGAASATFLLGVSLLYGGSGSLALSAFSTALASRDVLATAGVVLVLSAFFLKAAVAPFHTWAPDAYEAASVPVTAYMAAVVKAGGLFAVLRLFALAPAERPLVDLLALLPLASMVWGNLAAMRQDGLRRLIAYSSIAHAGYLFYAFLGDGPGRFQAVTFYLLVYGLMNVLALAALPPGRDDVARDRLERLKGLFQRQPYAAWMIAVAMLSLAGIPPFPGFVAKFLVFKNVVAGGHPVYAVLGLVGSYLGLYFYLRVIQCLFLAAPSAAEEAPMPAGEGAAPGRLALAATVLCLLPAILIALFPGWVLDRLGG